MQDKKFSRIIELGEWLEEYLMPDISTWKLLDLFKAGPKLLNVKEKISEDCKVSLFLMNRLPKDKHTPEEIEAIQRKANVFSNYQKDIQKILQEIRKYDLPWQKVLLEFEKDILLDGITGQLRNDYSKLRETIKKIDGEYCITSSFSPIQYFERLHKKTKENEKEVESDDVTENATFELVPNYRTILARILFGFLMHGGQDYYLFCEHCGRFTVIRRSGRKKFCSDICRTNHGREKKERSRI